MGVDGGVRNRASGDRAAEVGGAMITLVDRRVTHPTGSIE